MIPMYFDPLRYRHKEEEFTITTVGRKWAPLDRNNWRLKIETMWIDGRGYSSPGRCWLSREDWLKEKERRDQWKIFRDLVMAKYAVPDHLATEEIYQMCGQVQGLK